MTRRDKRIADLKRRLKERGLNLEILLVPNIGGFLVENNILGIGEKYWYSQNNAQISYKVYCEINGIIPKSQRAVADDVKKSPKEIIAHPSTLQKPPIFDTAKKILKSKGHDVFSDKNSYYLNGFPVTIQTIIQKAGLC
jgi:hypothetical protein